MIYEFLSFLSSSDPRAACLEPLLMLILAASCFSIAAGLTMAVTFFGLRSQAVLADPKAAEPAVYLNQADGHGPSLEEVFTEAQRIQLSSIKLEKMSTLGQMVAGISHEINDPINFIEGNLPHVEAYAEEILTALKVYQRQTADRLEQMEAALADAGVDLEFLAQDLPRAVNSIRLGMGRIRNTIQNLENFYRLDEVGMKPVNLEEGLDSTLALLQGRYKKRIEIIREYGQIPLVECNINQINQVFLILIGNAIEVLLEKGTGEQRQIGISTRCMGADRVAVMISDNGTGIPLEVQQHLFEPFYTTKPSGVGTGLGLPISHHIVAESHGGRIYCCSALGEGTTFIVELPIRQSRSLTAASAVVSAER